jgi:hemerythrin
MAFLLGIPIEVFLCRQRGNWQVVFNRCELKKNLAAAATAEEKCWPAMAMGADMFSLMTSMMTGIDELDADHRELVEIINDIASAERQQRNGDTTAALEHFQNQLESHFQREEAYLESIRFPDWETHAAHHTQTLNRLQEIRGNFAAQAEPPAGIASICFEELLRTVLQQDLEAVNWIADRKLRRK